MLGELWTFSAQIHCPGPQTLLYIWNRGRITHRTNTMTKTTHAKSTTPPNQEEYDATHRACPLRRRVEGKRKERHTHLTPTPPHRPPPHPVLPGITEIVFNALNTLNVRRAETLPRFTNSVIYLQDQTTVTTARYLHGDMRWKVKYTHWQTTWPNNDDDFCTVTMIFGCVCSSRGR